MTIQPYKQSEGHAYTEYVYALRCPVSDQIRYVGRSVDPLLRFDQHLENRPDGRKEKSEWLGMLQSRDFSPELIVLEIFHDDQECREGEIEWMHRLLDLGHELTNHIPRRLSERMAEQERKQCQLDTAIQRGKELFGETT